MQVLILLGFLPLILPAQNEYASFVNPFIGTGGHGHTFPGPTVPFGMVQLSPDTRVDGSWDGCSGYHYSDTVIYGFSHTHLSGTGCSDYGDIMLMPVLNEDCFLPACYASGFHHKNEKAVAGFYSVTLQNGITAELTATERTGWHRYTFPEKSSPSVVFDIAHRDQCLEGSVTFVNDKMITGFRRSKAWAVNQYVAFCITFSSPVKSCRLFTKGQSRELKPGEKFSGNDFKLNFHFNQTAGKLETVVSLSPVSEEGARLNMKTESKGQHFDLVKNEAANKWNKALSVIEVTHDSLNTKRVFYTALYHCMVQPNIYFDVDRKYRGRDDKIHICSDFDYYTVFSLWDTFRAWHPLMTVIDRKRTADFMQTMLAQYRDGGLLPVWELSSNETECMIGYHSVSALADAAVKAIPGFSYNQALKAAVKSAESRNRYGLGRYIDQGFLSVRDEQESVSKTLEYAYDDYCVAKLAMLNENDSLSQRFMKRAASWRNIIDPADGFAKPRTNGTWDTGFDPYEVNNHFTEANSFQYSFFVPHDVSGLIDFTGGPDKFSKALDRLFSAAEKTKGREQADITGLIGQYAHGNEPSHHMAYLYSYAGQYSKTRKLTRNICTDFYHDAPDGLIGNEDCGQMSAWFVMSSLGFYQVCPGNPVFTLTDPIFKSAVIHLENGKAVKIKTADRLLTDKGESLISNKGKPLAAPFITYHDLMNGAELNFALKNENNNNNIGVNQDVIRMYTGVPLKNQFVPAPHIKGAGASRTFSDSIKIEIIAESGTLSVDTGSGWQPYTGPFYMKSSGTISAKSVLGKYNSGTTVAAFYKLPHPDWKTKLTYPYNIQYHAGGAGGLIDGIRGETNWRKGDWQGYQLSDFEATLELNRPFLLSEISVGFLQDTRSWIVLPSLVTVETSSDGINFTEAGTFATQKPIDREEVFIEDARMTFSPRNCSHVRVKAKNYGILPSWHPGAGGKTFIFIDEISLK